MKCACAAIVAFRITWQVFPLFPLLCLPCNLMFTDCFLKFFPCDVAIYRTTYCIGPMPFAHSALPDRCIHSMACHKYWNIDMAWHKYRNSARNCEEKVDGTSLSQTQNRGLRNFPHGLFTSNHSEITPWIYVIFMKCSTPAEIMRSLTPYTLHGRLT